MINVPDYDKSTIHYTSLNYTTNSLWQQDKYTKTTLHLHHNYAAKRNLTTEKIKRSFYSSYWSNLIYNKYVFIINIYLSQIKCNLFSTKQSMSVTLERFGTLPYNYPKIKSTLQVHDNNTLATPKVCKNFTQRHQTTTQLLNCESNCESSCE